MKKLHFDYYMELSYEEWIRECHFTIKCIPRNTQRQRIEKISMEVEPGDGVKEGQDSFGNRFLYGSVSEEHNQFFFHIAGDAVTGLSEYEDIDNANMLGVYRYAYGLAMPGEKLMAYYNSLSARMDRELSAYEKGVFLMHCLYRDFSYEKNVTDVNTDAEAAWVFGRGVCQDYAHILIALCRLAGIPARYITGMLIGEGFSHAWVEILWEDRWYGLDPTNDLIVDDSHIKIGVGRDASDCMINRGIMKGGGAQTQKILVTVTEEGEKI